MTSKELQECKPIYREFKGWKQPTSGIRNFQDLPIEARNYIHAIESILSKRIVLVSTGPDRGDNIVLEDLFS